MCVQVIAPEEIIDPRADELSVMTYLSQFPKAKLKTGAPLKPKLNPKKARAYGPGAHSSHSLNNSGVLVFVAFPLNVCCANGNTGNTGPPDNERK